MIVSVTRIGAAILLRGNNTASRMNLFGSKRYYCGNSVCPFPSSLSQVALARREQNPSHRRRPASI